MCSRVFPLCGARAMVDKIKSIIVPTFFPIFRKWPETVFFWRWPWPRSFYKVKNFLTNSNKKYDISDCLFNDKVSRKIDFTAHGPQRDHPPAWESKSKLGNFQPFPEDRLGPGFSPFCAERLLSFSVGSAILIRESNWHISGGFQL